MKRLALLVAFALSLRCPSRDRPEIRPDLGSHLTPARQGPAMTNQRIIQGDCLDVFVNERNIEAFVSDPPANIAFMGRSWDKANPALDYVPLIPARDNAHLRELQSEFAFSRYWATRYAMAYDIADQHATNLVWTLPRTSHQTANALRAAGWCIKDNIVHLFGTGWAKSGNALAPGQEGWLLATKGKPDLDVDACRVPRGATQASAGGVGGYGGSDNAYEIGTGAKYHSNGSLPKNALLSHCEECVPVGSKQIATGKFTDNTERTRTGVSGACYGERGAHVSEGYSGKTESVPAWHCLAGCVCGARSKWDPEKPLPRCPCGETWRWLCAVAEVNAQSGDRPGMTGGGKSATGYMNPTFGGRTNNEFATPYADQGGSARFFNTFSYLAKCSSSERHAGCENLYWRANKKNPFGFDRVTREEWETLGSPNTSSAYGSETPDGAALRGRQARTSSALGARGNVHPTVKSYRLMHWLHSLTGAKKIGDLCGGSGTGMFTAYLDGIDWIGAEMCPEAIVIANTRLAFWKGLSFEARDAFMRDDIVPGRTEAHAAQTSLFEART